jgi:hypothetical protein
MGATQFVYSQARDETTCGNYIIPMTTRLETQITSQFGEMWVSQASGPNKPYKKPGLAYRPGQAEGVGLDW